MTKIKLLLIFLCFGLSNSGWTMDSPEQTQSLISQRDQKEPEGLDQAFSKSSILPEWCEGIVQTYVGSIYHLSLVCKKFNYILGKYSLDLRDVKDSGTVPFFQNLIKKNPCTLSIRLGECKLEQIMEPLRNLTGLVCLSINFFASRYYQDSSKKYSLPVNLRYLRCCDVMKFNLDWSSLKNLNYLNTLGCINMAICDADLGSLANLTHLNLAFCHCLKGISSEGIGNLSNLMHLDLSYNGYSKINSAAFKRLTKLEKLNLRDTYYEHGHNSLMQYCIDDFTLKLLTNLTWLKLENNKISNVFGGRFIRNENDKRGVTLPKLEFLSCNADLVFGFGGFSRLQNLKSLQLSNCDSTLDITKDICQLTSLRELTINPESCFDDCKYNTIPIIWGLWKHNLRIVNNHHLPEQSILNQINFSKARDICQIDPKWVNGKHVHRIGFKDYKDDDSYFVNPAALLCQGVQWGTILGGAYFGFNYYMNG